MPTQRSIKQYVFRAGAQNRIPVSGVFELTPRCNFRCRMCYIHMTPEEMHNIGRELTTEEWLALGREAVSAGMLYLLLTGGEPTLRPDFAYLYTELVKMGLLVSVNTNATGITPAILETFRKHPPETVNITLYGTSPESYEALCGVPDGYARARAAVQALHEAEIRIQLNTSFTRLNRDDMPELVAYAVEHHLPIRTMSFTFPPVRNGHPVCDVALTPEEQGELNARFELLATPETQRAKRAATLSAAKAQYEADRTAPPVATEGDPVRCMAGRGSFWIAWNGDMYPCGMLADRVAPREGSFKERWQVICDQTATVRLPAVCKTCAYRKLCPSCAAVCYTANGDFARHPQAVCRYMEVYADTYLTLHHAGSLPTLVPSPKFDGEAEETPFVCL